MGLTINDLRDLYNKGHYTYKDTEHVGAIHKLPEDYVFDDELSVRQNREMVIEHNKKVDEIQVHRLRKQGELDAQLTEDVVAYIKENYELTDKQARIVEAWTYREHHAFICDYFSYIDTFADFAENLVNCADS